jgi:hypothetical protein
MNKKKYTHRTKNKEKNDNITAPKQDGLNLNDFLSYIFVYFIFHIILLYQHIANPSPKKNIDKTYSQ